MINCSDQLQSETLNKSVEKKPPELYSLRVEHKGKFSFPLYKNFAVSVVIVCILHIGH